jgi:ribosomal protein S14
MARTAIVHKCRTALEKAERAHALGKKPKHSTRLYHRCSHCGRAN